MNDKPKEFWIFRSNKPLNDVVLFQEPLGTHSSEYVHVIRKSKYDEQSKLIQSLQKELAECKEERSAFGTIGYMSGAERMKDEYEKKIEKLEQANKVLFDELERIITSFEVDYYDSKAVLADFENEHQLAIRTLEKAKEIMEA